MNSFQTHTHFFVQYYLHVQLQWRWQNSREKSLTCWFSAAMTCWIRTSVSAGSAIKYCWVLQWRFTATKSMRCSCRKWRVRVRKGVYKSSVFRAALALKKLLLSSNVMVCRSLEVWENKWGSATVDTRKFHVCWLWRHFRECINKSNSSKAIFTGNMKTGWAWI